MPVSWMFHGVDCLVGGYVMILSNTIPDNFDGSDLQLVV